MNVKFIAQALQILGWLPLLAYPAVLIANAMQAAALLDKSQSGAGSRGRRALMGIFVAGTTAYPLVLIACRVLVGRAQAQPDETGQLVWSAAPLLFLGALAALFVGMERTEHNK